MSEVAQGFAKVECCDLIIEAWARVCSFDADGAATWVCWHLRVLTA